MPKVSVLVLNTEVLVLVLVLMPKVSVLVLNTKVLVLMPKVSVLVLKLGLGIVFWQLNKCGSVILKCNVKYNVKEKAIESIVTLCIQAWAPQVPMIQIRRVGR